MRTVLSNRKLLKPKLVDIENRIRGALRTMPKARAVFRELARLLGQQSYFAGDAMSLADLLVAPSIEFFTQTPEWAVLGAPHANLVAWLARMDARPSLKATTWERVSEMAKAA